MSKSAEKIERKSVVSKGYTNYRSSKNDRTITRISTRNTNDNLRGLFKAKFPNMESNKIQSVLGRISGNFVKRKVINGRAVIGDYWLHFSRSGRGWQLTVVENIGFISFNGQSNDFRNEFFDLSLDTDKSRFLYYASKCTKKGDKTQKFPVNDYS